jgi:gluconate 2-dehydrogenase alpha chain
MGSKFLAEIPRWRRNDGEPTQEATFSLADDEQCGRFDHPLRGWLRRFHPHHFQMLSHVKDRWGLSVLPPGCTLADWPVTYEELEPYYTLLEHEIGIAGDESNPFIKRSKPCRCRPRPVPAGRTVQRATERIGLHPIRWRSGLIPSRIAVARDHLLRVE